MCGITGYLNLDGKPASARVLRAMTDAIAHRGPDGEGFFVDGGLGLRHRQLAIIDLTPAGDQPITSADGRHVISYNGEVYNFRELRKELEAKEYRFRSKSDAEVVLNAFAEWGERALDRMNGMFAFAIWDRRRKELTLARDRYGIKPLYYTLTNGAFVFGSEIKAILAHPGGVGDDGPGRPDRILHLSELLRRRYAVLRRAIVAAGDLHATAPRR